MAIASLKYRPGGSAVEESKSGFVVFDGAPHEYHYWHFRTELKFAAIPLVTDESKPTDIAFAIEKRKECLRQVVENLKGDALNVAMEIGIETLYAEGGGERLLTEIC